MFSYNEIVTLFSLVSCLFINFLVLSSINPFTITILILIMSFVVIVLGVVQFRKKRTNKAENYDSMTIEVQPNDNDSSHEIEIIAPSIIEKLTNVEQLNKDLKPFGFAYNPIDDLFYSIMDGWQKDCGYCELYDEGAAALSMIIDCEPIRFEYAGKKWLIEFWKGQYGMTVGCELGVYSTKGPNLNIPGIFDGTFYYCVEEQDYLNMAFSLYKHDSLLLRRNQLHWWLTAFKLGEFSNPSDLTMEVIITLKDTNMCNAFVNGLRKTGYSDQDLTIQDNTVQLVFDKPHSPQPMTRTSLIEYLMQANNKRNCEAYHFATHHFSNTLDKLEYVKAEAPRMYGKIMNVGSTKELFGSYYTIQNYLGHDNVDND